jgi:hypothetical protein
LRELAAYPVVCAEWETGEKMKFGRRKGRREGERGGVCERVSDVCRGAEHGTAESQ